MSSLKATVARGLEALGLHVEQDRGGLTVDDGLDGQRLAVRVDETERMVRVEGLICYPVDDFSPELSLAMDHLNRVRAGVCFAYLEAQRALAVFTSWSSPVRDPSSNQLHLLIGLVQEARGRDGPALERVAEGDGSWEEVKDPEPEPQAPGARATGRRGTRFSDEAPELEAPTRQLGRATDVRGAVEPVTRRLEPEPLRTTTTRFSSTADGVDDDAWDQVFSGPGARDLATQRQDPPATPRGGQDDEATVDEPPPAAQDDGFKPTSRTALQMAIQNVERREPERVDLSAARQRPARRFLVGLLKLAAFLGVAYVVVEFFVRPFVPHYFVWETWFPKEPEVDHRLVLREQASPKELLRLELEDPLDAEGLHAQYLARAMDGLGEELRGELELLVVGSPNGGTRAAALELWSRRGFADAPGARLELLRRLVEAKRHEEPAEPVVPALLAAVRGNPPPDAELAAALDWGQGDVWRAFVDVLARPGDGAEKRSKALARWLDRDTPDLLVLRSMVKTGFAPPDAATRLVVGNGVEWARGEGQALLVGFVTESPDGVAALSRHEDEAYRVLAVELLAAAGTPAAAERLARQPLRDASGAVRIKAAIALTKLAEPATTWPIAVELCRRNVDPALATELRSALQRIPPTESIKQLQPRLAHTRSTSERFVAIQALAALGTSGAASALVEALAEPDVNLRRTAAEKLDELARTEAAKPGLNAHLPRLREAARSDPTPAVRQAIARVYRGMTGHDP